MLNINRGNKMLHLSSTASQSRGLNKYIVDNGGSNQLNARVKFKLGDVVTTIIKCAKGQTIVLSHDTNSPRPYSLNFRVQGTKGLWMKDSKSIYLEGFSPAPHKWESDEKYLKIRSSSLEALFKRKINSKSIRPWRDGFFYYTCVC